MGISRTGSTPPGGSIEAFGSDSIEAFRGEFPIRARPLKNKCTIQAETLRGNLPRLAPFIANLLSAIFSSCPC